MACKNECTCLSIIIGIIAGVILGILFALGFVATGIIFWAYLAIGVAGVFLLPVYAANNSCRETGQCLCNFRRLFTIASVGAIILSVIGLIVSGIVSIPALAITLGIATLFVVMLLVLVLCLARCLCNE